MAIIKAEIDIRPIQILRSVLHFRDARVYAWVGLVDTFVFAHGLRTHLDANSLFSEVFTAQYAAQMFHGTLFSPVRRVCSDQLQFMLAHVHRM